MSASTLTAPRPAPLRAPGPAASLSLAGWLRLAAVVVGCLLLVVEPSRLSGGVVLAAAAITALVVWERWRVPALPVPAPVVEAVVAVAAVVVSGGWTSPFGPVLGVDVAAAGLRGGYGRGARVAAVQVAVLLAGTAVAGQPVAGQLPLVLVLAAAIGGFAQRLLADVDLDRARWHDRLATLSGEFERARIARDLHDQVCQSLAAVSIALQLAAERGDAPDLADLAVRVRADLADLRETLFELRAGPPAAGNLAEAVHGYAHRVAGRAGLRVDVDVACPGGRLPLAVEQQLFRILQELLRNTVRHAGARHVTVTWRVDAERAVLEVDDDGRGFDPDAVADGGGLASVRERADALGAACDVDARPGDGTAVTVTIDRQPAVHQPSAIDQGAPS